MTDTTVVVSDNTRDLALETLAAARGAAAGLGAAILAADDGSADRACGAERGGRPESVEPLPGGQRSRRRIIDTYVDEHGER